MWYRKNVGGWERAARLIAGGLMLICGVLALHASPLGLLLSGAGVVTLGSGVFGYCPARRSCGGAARLRHRPPDRAALAILGRGRCRLRRATRMPDVLDSGLGPDAFARPSRFNDRIVVGVREPAPRSWGWRATVDEDGHDAFVIAL